MSLNNVPFTIVGVLASDEDTLTGVLTSGMLMAYIPYPTLVRVSTTAVNNITTFYIAAPEGGTVEDAEKVMEDILMERFEEDEDAFDISSQNMLEEAMDKENAFANLADTAEQVFRLLPDC